MKKLHEQLVEFIAESDDALMEKFRAGAAKRLGVAVNDLKLAEGVALAADGRKVSLADMADERLTADGVFSNENATYTYGTAVAHVAVDPKTGKVDVLDYTVVDDVGRIINPITLHGQVVGAAVQGLGGVFSEEIAYDENGQLLVGSLADYMIPLATDYPQAVRAQDEVAAYVAAVRALGPNARAMVDGFAAERLIPDLTRRLGKAA